MIKYGENYAGAVYENKLSRTENALLIENLHVINATECIIIYWKG